MNPVNNVNSGVTNWMNSTYGAPASVPSPDTSSGGMSKIPPAPVTAPVTKPTSVVSSSTAAAQTGSIKSTLSDYELATIKKAYDSQQIADKDSQSQSTDRYLLGSNATNPNYKPEPISPLTSGSGDSTTPATPTNPLLTRTDVTSSIDAPGGLVYKQFSDGTYARVNLTTGEATSASSSDYQLAQQLKTANDSLSNLQNGILSPEQQSQVDNIKSQFTSLIEKQQTDNANRVGATSLAENLYGMGNTISGQGEIAKVVNDGAQKVADLQSRMADAISKMKQGFLSDDMDTVKLAYDTYNTSQQEVEKSITSIKDAVQKAQDKTDSRNSSFALSMMKKYGDTEDPITEFDTPAQVMQKLAKSPKYQQDQAVTSSLTPEENQFWADMAVSGVGKDISIPGLGLGKTATEAKIQILKTIASNAQKLGLSASDVAQSINDKSAAAKTYQRVLTQGSLISAAENKVEQDFGLVKKLGSEIKQSDLDTGIPLLQDWIRTGELAATNNPKLNNYLNVLTTTLTAYGRVVAGSTGAAGITKAANDEAQSLLRKGLSVSSVNDFIDNGAIPEMKNTISGYNSSLKNLDSAINMAGGRTSADGNAIGGTSTSSTQSSGTQSTGGFADAW